MNNLPIWWENENSEKNLIAIYVSYWQNLDLRLKWDQRWNLLTGQFLEHYGDSTESNWTHQLLLICSMAGQLSQPGGSSKCYPGLESWYLFLSVLSCDSLKLTWNKRSIEKYLEAFPCLKTGSLLGDEPSLQYEHHGWEPDVPFLSQLRPTCWVWWGTFRAHQTQASTMASFLILDPHTPQKEAANT